VLLFDVEQFPVNPPSERICGISTHVQVRPSRLAAAFKSAIKQNPAKRSAPVPLWPLRSSVDISKSIGEKRIRTEDRKDHKVQSRRENPPRGGCGGT